jgi:hypothetical protein
MMLACPEIQYRPVVVCGNTVSTSSEESSLSLDFASAAVVAGSALCLLLVGV